MGKKNKVDYASAGVNLQAADEALDEIKKLARTTFNSNTLSDIGAFGGLFRPPIEDFENPVLVASADGVGTKLKLAFMTGIHDTVGQCIVNHCVNDILVQGATPLFFLDYVGVGVLKPHVMGQIVSGLTKSCKANGMPLLGGETAELPGFYKEGEYDLTGTIIGMVDQKKIIDGSAIIEGDVILGLPSDGLHTNGYSLARKVCFEMGGLTVDSNIEGITNPIGKELLTVHKSYLKPVMAVLKKISIHGMAHITGGGIPGNLIRIIPKGLKAVIDKSSWPNLPIFEYIQKTGGVEDADMFDAFNMGIGYIIVVKAADADQTREILEKTGQASNVIGQIEAGDKAVELK
ncbi:MAG: phosphoribosylformylglycinamidine cyclo-ligase [candidate division Zixibacteria bacterium]|nr:phosphoribosylformylglycinamidine cyclo-ligase [candidate division Zixibacteria bacterium]